jgi:Spy/CpxP family protein refolding chaperone
MKRFLTTLVLFSTLTFAQNGHKRLQEMKDRLKLTPEQTEQVRPILQDEAKQLRDLRAANSGTRRQMTAEAKKIRSDADAKLLPLLTPEQRSELEKIRAERKQERRQNRKAR